MVPRPAKNVPSSYCSEKESIVCGPLATGVFSRSSKYMTYVCPSPLTALALNGVLTSSPCALVVVFTSSSTFVHSLSMNDPVAVNVRPSSGSSVKTLPRFTLPSTSRPMWQGGSDEFVPVSVPVVPGFTCLGNVLDAG